MNHSTVSAIIIVYNDERFIARAIESALNQTYRLVETIVVDDGSEDRSLEIARSYADQGVIVITKENGGAASARNLGVQHSTGRYLAFLDSDDVWLPGKIEKMVDACSDVERPCVVYSGYHFVNEALQPIMRPFRATTTSPYQEMLQCRKQMLPSTMMVSREAFDALKGFPEDPRVRVHEDAVFSLLATRQFKSIPVPQPLALYLHSSSGKGRSLVYDYDRSVCFQRGVLAHMKPVLTEKEFVIFESATWINTFCKFAMHGQLQSARRLRKEMGINIWELMRSVRGMLAIFSAYSGLNLLCFCKNLYHTGYRLTHRPLKI